ncbi:MAG TPA: ATP synthase F1 subunit epsilon [bacterium]|nr:ATP synthase F1 subunit epsilon [bacterium]HPP88248.1 ATP synthase F1 subunit epsilon [bacterium]
MTETKQKTIYDYIKLEIVTKDGNIVFSDNISAANFPGEAGMFTVLPGHTPFLSSLKLGELKIKKEEKDEKYIFFTVLGGFCEVMPDAINVITHAAEPADKIDVGRAESAKKRAEDRLRSRDESIDIIRAEAALQRALVRLSTVTNYKNQEK